MKYIVSVSGGLSSSVSLIKAVQTYGKDNVIAVFADVKGSGSSHFWSKFPIVDELLHERFGGESRDTYRFLFELSNLLGIVIHRVESNDSIWSVMAKNKSFYIYKNKKFLCPASETLKREALARWILDNVFEEWSLVLGMGVWETHRTHNAKLWWSKRVGKEISVFSILSAEDDTCNMLDYLINLGLNVPSAYQEGFSHNNCNGTCVLAGQKHYANLYSSRYETYMYAAYIENSIRNNLKIKATILNFTVNGKVFPVTLYDFIDRIAFKYSLVDFGTSCSCFTQGD